MQVTLCELPGLAVIEPRVFGDSRGYFFECWNRAACAAAGLAAEFIQDNESLSRFGVVRGLHYQLPPYAQAKLVRVIAGTVRDVVVDLRRDSPTFGRAASVELSGENKRQVFIPRGFAHGFAVLSETALFAYKTDNVYAPDHERGIAFDDPALGLDWGLPRRQMVLSERDTRNPLFAEAELP